MSKRWQESNWLQALEGGIDSSHVSWLHAGGLKNDPLFKGAKGNEYNLNDLRPFFEVAEADGGLFVGARRNAEDGKYYWRITPYVMPAFTIVPPRGRPPRARPLLGADRRRELLRLHVRLPPDARADRPTEVAAHEGRPRRPQPQHPRHVPAGGEQGRRLPDRPRRRRSAARRSRASAGSRSRTRRCRRAWARSSTATKERLVSSDTGIIKARQKLRKAVEALRDHGVTPPGVDPAHHRVRSAAIVLPQAESFIDAEPRGA